jgi:ribosomal protein S12 methylthiotransferase
VNEAIKVSLISLGCARKLVDSEVLLGHAVEEGFLVAEDPRDADVVVVNTCGFIEAAKQESIDTLLSVARLKASGQLKGVVAVGCLAQRNGGELAAGMPELDAVLGISDYSGVPAVIRRIVNGSGRRFTATIDGGKPKTARSDENRVLLTPRSYSYLRISEGCDHTCTFCAIPSMRGRNRSKPEDVLVAEATGLAAQGVKELVLVAEDTTAYGLDTHRQRRIAGLLERLGEVRGIEWIRLMYAYPHTVGPELTRVLREHRKLVKYLDIPIQHISAPMLRAMKRGVSSEQVRGILDRLRSEVPGITVRTTLIVGFPGETEQDYQELERLVADYRFERMGVFTYSREEGTPAGALQGQVPADVAEARRRRLMALQQEVLRRQHEALVGTTLPVLVDGRDPSGVGFVGRTQADAPEIDCVVRLPEPPAGSALRSGDFVQATIARVAGYDLLAGAATPTYTGAT